MNGLSKKSSDFVEFSDKVVSHIEEYVVPQYGDQPDEHIQNMSIEEIKGKISSYVARIGKIQKTRGYEDAFRDCLKIAHFAQYVYSKLVKEISDDNL